MDYSFNYFWFYISSCFSRNSNYNDEELCLESKPFTTSSTHIQDIPPSYNSLFS
jgi:hypothetical protein